MNGRANCVLAVCCPPGSARQRAALADEMIAGTGCDKAEAARMAEWVIGTFDLAPAGTLQAFKDSVAKLAREPRA